MAEESPGITAPTLASAKDITLDAGAVDPRALASRVRSDLTPEAVHAFLTQDLVATGGQWFIDAGVFKNVFDLEERVILARPEYWDAVVRIFEHRAKLDMDEDKFFALVTGTPGIGKTTWIPFLVRHVYEHQTDWGFEGVVLYTEATGDGRILITWDADPGPGGITISLEKIPERPDFSGLLDKHLHISDTSEIKYPQKNMVLVTSPWNKVMKEGKVWPSALKKTRVEHVMPVWELGNLRTLWEASFKRRGPRNTAEQQLTEGYEVFGGVPRHIFASGSPPKRLKIENLFKHRGDHPALKYDRDAFKVLTRLPGAKALVKGLRGLKVGGEILPASEVLEKCMELHYASQCMVHIGRPDDVEEEDDEEEDLGPLEREDVRFASRFIQYAVAQVLVLRTTEALWRKFIEEADPLLFEMYGVQALKAGHPLHAVHYVVGNPRGGTMVDVPITSQERVVSWFSSGQEEDLDAANDVLYVPPAGYPVIDTLMLTTRRDLVVFQITLKQGTHSLDPGFLMQLKQKTRASRLFFVLMCHHSGDTRLPGEAVRFLRQDTSNFVCQAQLDMSRRPPARPASPFSE